MYCLHVEERTVFRDRANVATPLAPALIDPVRDTEALLLLHWHRDCRTSCIRTTPSATDAERLPALDHRPRCNSAAHYVDCYHVACAYVPVSIQRCPGSASPSRCLSWCWRRGRSIIFLMYGHYPPALSPVLPRRWHLLALLNLRLRGDIKFRANRFQTGLHRNSYLQPESRPLNGSRRIRLLAPVFSPLGRTTPRE